MYHLALLTEFEHTLIVVWWGWGGVGLGCCKEDPVEGSHILSEVLFFKLAGETWECLTTVLRAWRK